MNLRAFVLLLLWVPLSANAQSNLEEMLTKDLEKMYGMVLAQPHWLRRQGALSGCSIEFRALIQDWAFRQGRPLIVNGSIGIHAHEGAGAVFGLKVVMHEQNLVRSQVVAVPNPPHFAYLENGDNVNNARAFIRSDDGDTPGGRIFAFRFLDDHQIAITKSILDNNIRLLFNRKEGGGDVRIPLDFTVLDTDNEGVRRRGTETLEQFRACTSQLLKDVQERITR